MGYIVRHEEILKILSVMRYITVHNLAQRLQVSEVTIRKDLTTLESMGALIRTRGGARSAEDYRIIKNIDQRQSENLNVKKAIARRAAEMVSDGATIYIDAGTTCRLFAQEILDKNLRVVTCSIDVMVILSQSDTIAFYALGGSYRKESGSFIGPLASNNIRKFQFDTCFMGATGFSADGVFSSQNIIESELKEKVIQAASRCIVLADSQKFGIEAFTVFARAEQVDLLITDDQFTSSKQYEQIGIEVIKVS